MNTLYLTIPGKPQAKQRARRGAHGKWYNPQSDSMTQCEMFIAEHLDKDFKVIPKGQPVKLSFTFFFSPAKSEKNIEECQPYCKKGDIDNLSKFYMDVMSGIVFHDDNQIYSIDCEKWYTLHEPCTEIEVKW